MSFPRSSVLILGTTSIQSLVPCTLISQIDSLLDAHRLTETASLADLRRKKLQGVLNVDLDDVEELDYAYQSLGFTYLGETQFSEAGVCLFNGSLDPRVLVSYFPSLYTFSAEHKGEVYVGVQARMPSDKSCADIISANLVRNYSPHLKPSTRDAPPTAELRRILNEEAHGMLQAFLVRWKRKREVDGLSCDECIDTVLAKLYAQSENTTALYALLSEPNAVRLDEVQDVFRETGQYRALCILLEQRGKVGTLVEVLSRIAQGEYTDTEVPDPIGEMISLLQAKKDRTLILKWGIWLIERDEERGLQLLISIPSKKKDKEDDLNTLTQLREVSATAANKYLEHLVLVRKSTTLQLHNAFAHAITDALLLSLKDESVSKLWRAKLSSYKKQSSTTQSYLTYLDSTTPLSTHKQTRLKAILFLQASDLYDVSSVREKFSGVASLELERAILEGKMKNHKDALTILVSYLHDTVSAETYCALASGQVVPQTVARRSATSLGIEWVSLFAGPDSSAEVDKRKELVRVLLEVYLSDEAAAGPKRTTDLLDAQGMNMDVVDVLTLLPSSWPLHTLETFLTRSLRRTVHVRDEGTIVKMISGAQNLEVMHKTWLVLREQGAVVEEPADDENDGQGEGSWKEKGVLGEKWTEEGSVAVQDITPAGIV